MSAHREKPEQEEGLHRLLEVALGEVGGDHVGEADEQRRGGAAQRGKIAENRERGQRGQHGDRHVRPLKLLTRPMPRPLPRVTTIEWGPSG